MEGRAVLSAASGVAPGDFLVFMCRAGGNGERLSGGRFARRGLIRAARYMAMIVTMCYLNACETAVAKTSAAAARGLTVVRPDLLVRPKLSVYSAVYGFTLATITWSPCYLKSLWLSR